MSHRIARVSAAAVLSIAPLALPTAALATEPAPDLGFARNGGIPYTAPDLGQARNAIPASDPDIGRARDEIPTQPGGGPAPARPVGVGTGIDSATWVLLGATGVAAAGAAGFVVVYRRHHGHLAHPV